MGSGIRHFFCLGILLSLGACSRSVDLQTPTQPTSVTPSAVKSVLLSNSSSEADACESAIRQSGAKVLYRNEMGVLMTDRPSNELNLAGCSATVRQNERVELVDTEATKAAKELDLPTILRLIPAEEIGARSFVKQNPNFDGRGVVVAVLDTGIELDHAMLKTTSTGERKIIGFEDFSGEGAVSLAPVTVADGKFTSKDGKVYAIGSAGTDVSFGVFAGSSLKYNDEISAIDKFVDVGVVSYKNDKGAVRGKIDTNHNLSFDDEEELYDFALSGKFTKLGEKRLLTTSLSLSEDGKTASVIFDDGGHGTHVAGIAAGNEPNGLQGVAPGAQVICGKIGDNRLAGGSTTTASMMLAIDYAVQKKAQVVNLSYGIRSGTNIGKSTIDLYIDKVAREKGMIFSISAGNEGPGLLTIGTPAAADLAITNGAYVSKKTANDNYGYVGVEENNTWFFSSVGPRLDGGWKPTLLAPGSALSSVPMWSSIHGNFRGTSMASPHTTGGLALILSAAQQSSGLTDRAAVTRAVYDSAVKQSNLSLVEQGHGLMNVPEAFRMLAAMKESPVEYAIAVNSSTSPSGRGAGIFIRSAEQPQNAFTVTITPQPTPERLAKGNLLRTLKLVPSASWIELPETESLWIEAAPKTFQVKLSSILFTRVGLHSEVIRAVDEVTKQTVFEVPVTVIVPAKAPATQRHQWQQTVEIKPGKTMRYFIDVPAGATAAQVELRSNGPIVWAQLLDSEGRKKLVLQDPELTEPLPILSGATNLNSAGVYELDIVSPATTPRRAQVTATITLFSLTATVTMGETASKRVVSLQNNMSAVKIIPKVSITSLSKSHLFTISGSTGILKLPLEQADQEKFESIDLNIKTAKKLYDQMTDYPIRVFDKEGNMVLADGLELDSHVEVSGLGDLKVGDLDVEITGAFSNKAPEKWAIMVQENRKLKEAISVFEGTRVLLEPSQTREVAFEVKDVPTLRDLKGCPTLLLEDANNRLIQSIPVCE